MRKTVPSTAFAILRRPGALVPPSSGGDDGGPQVGSTEAVGRTLETPGEGSLWRGSPM